MMNISNDQPQMTPLELRCRNYIVMLRVTGPSIAPHLTVNNLSIDKLYSVIYRLLRAIDVDEEERLTLMTLMSNKEFSSEIDFKVNFLIKEICKEYPALTVYYK
jgi:hypothetical protein